MALIGSIVSLLIGAFFIFYALNLPAFMAGQYFMVGFFISCWGCCSLHLQRQKQKIRK